MKIQYLAIILLVAPFITENSLHAEATCSTNPPENDTGHSRPSSNPTILDSFGKPISGSVKLGQQIQILEDFTNGQDCDQPFAYLLQVQDINGVTVALSWITGTLYAGQSLSPVQSWTPSETGTYQAQTFVWQSLTNPDSWWPPESVTITVEAVGGTSVRENSLSPLEQFKSGIATNDVICQQGFQLIVKSEDGSPTCVKPDDVSRLIGIDWAESANQSHQLELWIFSCGSAYPVGGSMCLDTNRPFESPQNFNMTSVVHSFPGDVITLHSHAYCIKLKQYDKVKFGFNSTAPTNFTLYTTSNTLPSTNMVRCATNGKVISEMKNSTSYSNELNVQEDGLFTFVFDENTPVLANVNFVYSWVPR